MAADPLYPDSTGKQKYNDDIMFNLLARVKIMS